MIPVFLILTFAVFVLSDFAPGNAVDIIASEQRLSDEAYEALLQEYGLDQPLPLRYINWLADFAQGDMGESVRNKAEVADLIGDRLGPSCLLYTSRCV